MTRAILPVNKIRHLSLVFAGSLFVVYRIARENFASEKVWVTFAPFAVLLVVLGFLNLWLFLLPMAMRM